MIKKKLNKQMLSISIIDTKDFRHLSLADISKQTGLSKATISRMCNGTYLPDVETYATICEWLKINMESFFTISNPK